MKSKFVEAAIQIIEKEKFDQQVAREVEKLKWTLWRKLFPYKITIKVVDLRKKD